jgi:hypothetical protein
VSKFTYAEKALVKSIVANLTIKRIQEFRIIKEVYKQTNKTITRQTLYNLRQQIKLTLGWIFFLDFVRIQLGIHFYSKIV